MTGQPIDSCWGRMVQELQRSGLTLQAIGDHCGASMRQVCKWKNGTAPTGMRAIKLYLLHARNLAEERKV